VDEIARIADVSPRTFFNYFSSKEEAIVGDGPEMPPDDAQARFIADRSPILPALAELFASSITPALADQEIVQLRRTLMKAIPDLGARRWATMHRFEGEIAELVARRLAHQHPDLADDDRELIRQARLTTFLAIGAMRHAWLTWMEDNGDQGALIERMHDSFAMVPAILDPASPSCPA
jgi:AcrR family transcriptional regulator